MRSENATGNRGLLQSRLLSPVSAYIIVYTYKIIPISRAITRRAACATHRVTRPRYVTRDFTMESFTVRGRFWTIKRKAMKKKEVEGRAESSSSLWRSEHSRTKIRTNATLAEAIRVLEDPGWLIFLPGSFSR